MKWPIKLMILIAGILLLLSSDVYSQDSSSQNSTKELTLYELRQSVKYLTEVEYRREKDMLAQTQFKLYDSTIAKQKEQNQLLEQKSENYKSIIEELGSSVSFLGIDLDKFWVGVFASFLVFFGLK